VAGARVKAVLVAGPGSIQVEKIPVPPIGIDDGLLEVEACGICGTDVEQAFGPLMNDLGVGYPFIPGHEIVGRIAQLGEAAKRRWGLVVGDRVAVEPSIPCGHCEPCLTGRYTTCDGWPESRYFSYGFIPQSCAPGLWGGYAENVYLHPSSLLHRVPPGMPPAVAALFQPLGAGFEWMLRAGNVGPGHAVGILGAGQRGLACVIAARMAGASNIIVTGRERDRHKLELALDFGASHTINVDTDGPVPALVERYTRGQMCDVVIDTSAGAIQPVLDAVEIVRPSGTVLLAGLKSHEPVDGFVSDLVVWKNLTIKGVLAVSSFGYRLALDALARPDLRLHRMATSAFRLEDAEAALNALSRGDGQVSVCIRPGIGRQEH
jgi:threonine dehydrogenase-like Zn-dependent dehydrogenase